MIGCGGKFGAAESLGFCCCSQVYRERTLNMTVEVDEGSGAETILKLIETVDLAYTTKLDEIDALTWCWYYQKQFSKIGMHPSVGHCMFYIDTDGGEIARGFRPYTRSRDVLKAIRPEGWRLWVHSNGTCEAVKRNDHEDQEIISQARTEELAELHAIIQAIEYERQSVAADV